MNFIHSFFESNKGFEFVGIEVDDYNENNCNYKVKRYHLFTRYYRISDSLKLKRMMYLRAKAEAIVNRILPNRHIREKYYKGSNWVSISNNFVHF